MQLQAELWDEAIRDLSTALDLQKDLVQALQLRAQALTKLEVGMPACIYRQYRQPGRSTFAMHA